MDRDSSLPRDGNCPQCNAQFTVTARSEIAAWQATAIDELEWACKICGHKEVEEREKANGIGGEWPASKFQPRTE